MQRFDVGCYKRIDKSGICTYYIKIKSRYIRVGVEEKGRVNPEYVRKFRAKLMNQDLDRILPRKNDSTCMTIKEAYEKYLEYLEKKNRGESTNVRPAVSRYTKHIGPYIGELKLTQVTPGRIVSLQGKWVNLAQTTQRNLMTLLSALYTTAKRFGYRGYNPMDDLSPQDKITAVVKRGRFLTVQELNDLLVVLKGIDYTTFVQAYIASYAGLRLKEILNLTVNDLNLSEGTIRVCNAKHTTDKNRVRYVQIGPDLIKVLDEFVKSSGKVKLFNGFDRKAYYRAISACRLNDRIDPKDQVNRIGMHSLRHTFACHMLQSGSNLKEVQEALGHKQISSTMVYMHVNNDQMVQASERMESFRAGVTPRLGVVAA